MGEMKLYILQLSTTCLKMADLIFVTSTHYDSILSCYGHVLNLFKVIIQKGQGKNKTEKSISINKNKRSNKSQTIMYNIGQTNLHSDPSNTGPCHYLDIKHH